MSIFDEEIDRRNTGSYKWDVAKDVLPMWVADMDFKAAPGIQEALSKRIAHGIYGYATPTEEWAEAYMDWWGTRHQLPMEKDWLIFTTGIVPAISSIVRKLTTPAEKVIVMTPTYNIFFNSIENNGRYPLECPLHYEDGVYSIDFKLLEKLCKDPQCSLLILCNPQNPTGNIWSREELSELGRICYENHVVVVSDEIHCDITLPGKDYVPFLSVSEQCRENCVMCIAPTKAFNIAGLQTAAVCIPNPVLRHKVWRGLNTDEVAEGNAFAYDVAIAAFRTGGEWLSELREYVAGNRAYAEQYIKYEIPLLKAVHGEATYLLWIDCSKITSDSWELAGEILKLTGLFVSEGCEYHGNGRYFLRMNLACPRSRVMDGMKRLKEAVLKLSEA